MEVGCFGVLGVRGSLRISCIRSGFLLMDTVALRGRASTENRLEQRVGEGLVIVPVSLVISADRTFLRVYKAE